MDDVSVEGISKILRDLGYQKHGNECMYNGHTGRPFDSLIFLGPTFYQVSAHPAMPVAGDCCNIVKATVILSSCFLIPTSLSHYFASSSFPHHRRTFNSFHIQSPPLLFIYLFSLLFSSLLHFIHRSHRSISTLLISFSLLSVLSI